MYSEDDLIPISALQHVLYCERQYALIHLEQLWEENRFTAEGTVLHENVDRVRGESRRLQKTEYGLAIRSLEHGLIGKADVVEITFRPGGGYQSIVPVEFKRGRSKEEAWDRVQLCAQALCLEEMFGCSVPEGQFYYLQDHRRKPQAIDDELRRLTISGVARIREIDASSRIPTAVYSRNRCDRCSLVDLCMPKYLDSGGKNVQRYVANQSRQAMEEPD